MERIGKILMTHPSWVLGLVFLALLGLPLALWQDMDALSHRAMERQSSSMNAVLTAVRGYYAENVIDRILHHDGNTQALHNYAQTPGAVPIPATLSLELGAKLADADTSVTYRFVSDFPFTNRAPHELTAFEIHAIDTFRAAPEMGEIMNEEGGSFLDHSVTVATPIRMTEACVACHNSHPESTKIDWAEGDVRGVQVVTIHQPIAQNIWAFRWLLTYLVLAGGGGILFAMMQFRLARNFATINDELSANNNFLADVSAKVSKYLEPQVYKSIFAGERDVSLTTERKKLTVFFSDIKDFTATTERMQPEELTALLNEYFTEMSRIAQDHGATIDKFIGDAIVAFFGDPSTNGPAEDARACVRMALAMQDRLEELETVWRQNGLEHPFRARMGLNTGYCNVGNFGSDTRMDYTIIGAEANLAARLESIAEPGGIVMSYETFAHAHDLIEAEPLAPQRFKGISREITPYRVIREPKSNVAISTHKDGDMLVVDLQGIDTSTREAIARAVNAELARKSGD
ncbi:adenylate/guanylate cyclase domain-containing protein [Shimia sp. Alg240-R146]|uniref:adenylate/guanylate cyclase domain-containing protein n=1 Tax=Shimia sp. Alg240-R146 TaxID=2993449 RepID=UPI0022E2CCF0|nr:adenylate/guanylate cyclase domain-containing protein [Shimia sp. Alg240-R146]